MTTEHDLRRMSTGAYLWYKFWSDKCSLVFDLWWKKSYGEPKTFGADDLESDAADDYYRRKSFALNGWLAYKELTQDNTLTAILEKVIVLEETVKIAMLHPLIIKEPNSNDK